MGKLLFLGIVPAQLLQNLVQRIRIRHIIVEIVLLVF